MSSSIFNFEPIRAYFRLSRRERLWHVAVVAALVLTHAGARALLSRYGDRFRGNYITKAREALSGETEVVFLGNSHFYSGIRADLLPFDAMTVAGSGFNYQIMRPVLERQLDRLPNLRVAVIAFDANPLLNEGAMSGTLDSPEMRDWGLSSAEMPRRPGTPEPGSLPALDGTLRRYLVPHNRIAPEGVLISLGLRDDPTVPGHIPSEQRFQPWPGRVGKVAHHRLIFRDRQFEPNCESLLAMIRQLDRRGVRVILLRPPFHPSYVAERPERWEEFCDEALERVRNAEGLSQTVEVWDFMKNPTFADADFRDDDHLNSTGAARLSALVSRPLQTELARQESATRLADDARRRAEVRR